MHLHIFCCLKFFHTFEINPLNEINAFISLIPLLFFTCGYFFWYNTICLVEAKGKGLDPNCSHHIFVSVPSKHFNLYQIKWMWLSSFGVLKFDARVIHTEPFFIFIQNIIILKMFLETQNNSLVQRNLKFLYNCKVT